MSLDKERDDICSKKLHYH